MRDKKAESDPGLAPVKVGRVWAQPKEVWRLMSKVCPEHCGGSNSAQAIPALSPQIQFRGRKCKIQTPRPYLREPGSRNGRAGRGPRDQLESPAYFTDGNTRTKRPRSQITELQNREGPKKSSQSTGSVLTAVQLTFLTTSENKNLIIS